MNVMASMAALAGIAVLCIVVYFGDRSRPWWKRLTLLITGILLAAGVTRMAPVLFGDDSLATARLARHYLWYLMLLAALVMGIRIVRHGNRATRPAQETGQRQP